MLVKGKWRAKELRLPLLLGGFISLSILISTYYLNEPEMIIVLLVSFSFIFVILRWPEIGILTLVGITGGLVDTERLPFFDLGPVSLHISDLMLILLLGLVLLRATSQPGFRLISSPLTTPLLLFFGAILVSIINAIFIYGVDANKVFRLARILFYWLAFFPTLHLIRDERSLRRLIAGLWILAAIFIVGIILPGLFSPLPFLPNSVIPLTTAGREIVGTTRVYSASERLLYVMIPVAICTLATTDKGRPFWRIGALIGLLFWLFRSYQRNYWLTTALNCALLVMFLPGKVRIRLLKRLLPLASLGLVLLIVLQVVQPGLITNQLQISTDRLASLLDEPTKSDASIQWRIYENQHALQKIGLHPLLGLGLANSYRPLMGDELVSLALDWYAHNAYLWIAVMMGLLGLLPFLWLSIAYLSRTFRWWREIPDGELRGIYLGFGIAFLGMMVSNLVAPNFVQTWSLTIYPVMMGISEGILRISKERKRKTISI